MKKILITSARSGIIKRVLKYFKTDEFYMYLTFHTDSQLNWALKKYKNYSNIKCFKLDLKEDNKEFLENLDIDVLVLNGALAMSGSLIEMPFEQIRENLEVNYFGNLKIIKQIIIKMIDKNSGKIIVVSSLAGKIPMPFLGAYSSSKAALTMMMEALNLEIKLLNKNIDICIIEPGLYNTGFNKLAIDKKYEFMNESSFFANKLNIIRKYDKVLLFFERKNLDSIAKKIYKAIISKKPHLHYRAPLSQVLFVKFYNLFK